ncbi:MAG TPA: LysE family translocator [Actinomycetes bacterium]|nr:LysE family translocator [Actinomycetes bacterium]
MPSTDHLLAFAAVSLIYVAIPGPSVLFTISRALTLGRRPALLTVVGNSAGIYLQVIAVALGIGVIVERSLAVFTVIKIAGAIYLVYLGVQAIRHRGSLSTLLERRTGRSSARRVVVDGFIVGSTNPKGVIFFAAVLPQFVDPARGYVPMQLLMLGMVSIAAALVSDSLWAVLASGARQWFARSPRRLAAIGGSGGLIMVGLGVNLAVTGRQD